MTSQKSITPLNLLIPHCANAIASVVITSFLQITHIFIVEDVWTHGPDTTIFLILNRKATVTSVEKITMQVQIALHALIATLQIVISYMINVKLCVKW
jgi:hypothetical protein